jgi:hypothetical protein
MIKINRFHLILGAVVPISVVLISIGLIAMRSRAPEPPAPPEKAKVAKNKQKAAKKSAVTSPPRKEAGPIVAQASGSIQQGRPPKRRLLPKQEPKKTAPDLQKDSEYVPSANPPVAVVKEPEYVASANPPLAVVEQFLSQTALNKFGNPEGEGLGLAAQNEFKGARLVVWTGEPYVVENIFTTDNPLWSALRDRGFDVQLKPGRFQPAWLRDADQLWIFSSDRLTLSNPDLSSIIAFVESGKGLYLIADNEPYVFEARQLVRKMFDTNLSGDYEGKNLIAVRGHGVTRDDFRRSGLPKKFNLDAGETRSRLEVIKKATHYADEHPLLTDVNFIYEGATISHLDPTQRLQTVLTASDGQILAAISVDPSQRVLVDCGFTRYYYGPNPDDRLVTETAGTLRYAENIAAFLMGKENKGTDFRWQERRDLLAKYLKSSESEILSAFRSINPNDRWAAVTAALRRRLNMPEPLVGLMDDARPDVSSQAHRALVQLAGMDFGPRWNASVEEKALSRAVWARWLRREKLLAKALSLPPDEVAAMLRGTDPDERAAGLVAAFQRRLELADAYITLLRDPDTGTRDLAHKALVQIASGEDFGPERGAGESARSAAIDNWQDWSLVHKYKDLGTIASTKQVSAALHSAKADQRRAAVLAIRKRRLPMGNDLVDALGDSDVAVQQDARRTLKLLAGNEDFGPDPGATVVVIAKAKAEWKSWWDRKERKIRTQMLSLAKSIYTKDRVSARERLQEIVDRYAGTEEAREARTLLDKK